MSKRKWIPLVVALLVSLVLTLVIGFGPLRLFGEPTPRPTVQIQFWHAMAEDSAHGKALQSLVAEFNASQREVRVAAAYQGSYADIDKKLADAQRTGHGVPAVVQATNAMVGSLALARRIEPLDRRLPAAEWADFPANYLAPLTVDHARYGVPFNRSLLVLVYNKRLVATPPRTWAELQATAARLTRKQSAGLALAPDIYSFEPFFYQAGGQWFKYGRFSVASAEGTQALGFLQGLAKNGSAVLLGHGEYATDYLNDGRAAMAILPAASYPYLRPLGKGDAWAAAPLPAGPAGSFTAQSGANLVIPAGLSPAEAEAAATFMRWLTGKEATLKFALSKTGYGPVRLSAVSDPRWQAFVHMNPEYEPLGSQMQRALAQPTGVRDWGLVQAEVSRAVERALTRGMPYGDALDEAASNAQRIFNRK